MAIYDIFHENIVIRHLILCFDGKAECALGFGGNLPVTQNGS